MKPHKISLLLIHLHNAKAFLRVLEFYLQEENYSLWIHGRYFYLNIISPGETQKKEFKVNVISKFLPMTHEITFNLFYDSDMFCFQLNTLAEKNVISVQVLFRRWDWESCALWECRIQIKEMAYNKKKTLKTGPKLRPSYCKWRYVYLLDWNLNESH